MIGLATDHAGFELKEYVKTILNKKGIAYKDFGTYSSESCDYADFAHPLAAAVASGEVYPGIAFCSSGNGINMTLNRHKGVRAALCWNVEITQLSRAHNDANILVLPGRFITLADAELCIDIFLKTAFEGGRHQRRIEKIEL